MAGGTHTTDHRKAAIEAACQLMDLGAPTAVVVITLQRQHGYSRAQAYRITQEAGELRGQQGISARPTGSDLAAMAQVITAQALASASLEGDWKVVGRLARELRETLNATGSITATPAPEPNEPTEAVIRAHAMRQVSSETDCSD